MRSAEYVAQMFLWIKRSALTVQLLAFRVQKNKIRFIEFFLKLVL
jgi:hypothetical protein